jgi:hypothetical protein
MDTSLRHREGDSDKFKRLAVKRVNNAIKHIRLIGNLSNASNYSYTEQDVKKIFYALKLETETVEERFKKKQPKKFILE